MAASEFESLLLKARDGDRDAVASLLDNYRDYLLLIANRQMNNRLQAKVACSDIVQETLISAQDRFEDFRGDDPHQLQAWLRQFVVNDVYEAARRYKGTAKRQVDREVPINQNSSFEYPLVDQELTPKTNALVNEEARRLDEAMKRLSEDYQEVLKI